VWGEEELEEGRQKVWTSRYKKESAGDVMYNMRAIANSTA